MDETMTVWYEVTDKKYVQALRDAADQLERTGYAKLYLENVTIPGDGRVNDPAYDKSTWGVSGSHGLVFAATGGATGGSWPTGAAGGAGGAGGTPNTSSQGATGGGCVSGTYVNYGYAGGGSGDDEARLRGGGGCVLPPDHAGPCRER